MKDQTTTCCGRPSHFRCVFSFKTCRVSSDARLCMASCLNRISSVRGRREWLSSAGCGTGRGWWSHCLAPDPSSLCTMYRFSSSRRRTGSASFVVSCSHQGLSNLCVGLVLFGLLAQRLVGCAFHLDKFAIVVPYIQFVTVVPYMNEKLFLSRVGCALHSMFAIVVPHVQFCVSCTWHLLVVPIWCWLNVGSDFRESCNLHSIW